MRQILLVLIFSWIIACKNKENKIDKASASTLIDSITQFSRTEPTDSVALFLNLFSQIEADDLHVYSPNDTITTDKFQGRQIPVTFYKYLKFHKNTDPVLTDTLYHFYGCFRFKISDTKTGLIIRRPSQYSETAIDLYTWDNFQKKVIDIINLTDAFGDEGWYFVQDAWLKDLNSDNRIDIVTRRKDFDQDLDDTSKITRKDAVLVYLNNGTAFKKSTFKLDTLKFQLKYWTDN